MNVRIYPCFFLLFFGLSRPAAILAQDCDGAAISTRESYLYGRFETRMQSSAGDGIVSSFFLYNINTHCNWPAENNEIDVEMTGNNQQIYFTTHHPHPTHPWYYGEQFYLGFNPHESLNEYAIEWEPGLVRWFVNDQLIYTQNELATNNLQYPMAILMNLWAAKAEDWVGVWDPSILPRESRYDYVSYYRYTPGQGHAGTDHNFTFEWKDDFEVLDTSRWEVSDLTGFDGNYCTFRANNVLIDDSQLVLNMVEPTADPELIEVSFSVDVAPLATQTADVVYLNGTFNNWCGTCMPMHQQGDVWNLSIYLEPGRHEYLFTLNGWEELGNAPMGSACDYNPCDAYANYGLAVPSGSEAIHLETVCWEQCSDCSLLSTTRSNASPWKVYPNPFSNQLIIQTAFTQVREFCIYSVLGERILTGQLTSDVQTIDTSSWPPGIYVLKAENQSIRLVKIE